ncbi:MAG: hypothetical protein ABEH47_02270 [Haloferacaceae archaeon]
MAMGPWLLAATALAAVNVVLLAALTGVWVRNYRKFGTNMVAGLVAFGGVMLVENVVAIYFFFSTAMLYAGDVRTQQAVVVLRALEAVALAFLTVVTVR